MGATDATFAPPIRMNERKWLCFYIKLGERSSFVGFHIVKERLEWVTKKWWGGLQWTRLEQAWPTPHGYAQKQTLCTSLAIRSLVRAQHFSRWLGWDGRPEIWGHWETHITPHISSLHQYSHFWGLSKSPGPRNIWKEEKQFQSIPSCQACVAVGLLMCKY